MSIDVDTETLISFCEARSAFPGGKRLSFATLHRWRLSGVRGTKLETCLVGGLRYTSREAIQRFIANQNREESPAPVITAEQRRKRAEVADQLLKDALIFNGETRDTPKQRRLSADRHGDSNFPSAKAKIKRRSR